MEEARYFADELRDVSKEPVIYAELGGAQHAFDLFCSPRTSHMLVAVLKFLDATHANACNQVVEEELANDGVGYLGVAVP